MKLAIVHSETDEATEAAADLKRQYNFTGVNEADVIVALGGDGFVLHTLHEMMQLQKPIFGLNKGTVGFLMNEYNADNLEKRIKDAQSQYLYPLKMRAETVTGRQECVHAINEVSLLRETRQAAKIRVYVDDKVRLEELVCDGILVATPAGSTAYNLSAHGPILPLGAELLALTPISAFRPRRWRGAILPHHARIHFEILDCEKRPVSAVADQREVRDVRTVSVEEDRSVRLHLLFDPNHNLDERILMEQFIE